MKKLLSLTLTLALLFSVQLFSAVGTTNSNSVGSAVYTYGNQGYITSVSYTVTFTADSINSQATAAFTVPEYNGVNPLNYPITFRLKANGGSGTPARELFVQGLYTSTTDTVSIDTISTRVVNQRETDTTGVLTLNSKKAPLGYKVFIRNRTADIHTGTLTLVFPIPPEAKARLPKATLRRMGLAE